MSGTIHIMSRNRRFLPLLLMVFLLSPAVSSRGQARGTVISSVHLSGAAHIDPKEKDTLLQSLRGDTLSAALLQGKVELLLQSCRRSGYYFARCDSAVIRMEPDSASCSVDITITEGEQLRVENLELVVSGGIQEDDIRSLLNTRKGGFLIQDVVLHDMERILAYLEDRGYPLARVAIRRLDIRTDPSPPGVLLTLEAVPGTPIPLGEIRFRGNSITAARVLLRETRLRRGSPFSRSALESARARLRRLLYLRSADEPEIVFTEGEAQVTFPVEEARSNTFDGLLGYVPSENEREKGYMIGEIDLDFENLLGTGRALRVFWQKKDRFSQLMRLAYEEPWLLGLPWNAGASFQQEIRDTSYVKRELRITGRYDPYRSLSLTLGAGSSEVLPDSLAAMLQSIPRSRDLFLSLSADYSTLNDVNNPRRGVRYLTSLEIGRKENLGPDALLSEGDISARSSTRHLVVDCFMAAEVAKNHVAYLHLHGEEIRTGEGKVPISDQIRFGGARTLRGYNEDRFSSTLASWNTLEYRFLFGPRSRVFLFLDGAVYRREDADKNNYTVKFGYGFGLRLETRLGVVGIDYGLGEGATLTSAKIHVGLENNF